VIVAVATGGVEPSTALTPDILILKGATAMQSVNQNKQHFKRKILYRGQYTGLIYQIGICSICEQKEEGITAGQHHICFQCYDEVIEQSGLLPALGEYLEVAR
jgi:hypothetical protein